MAKSTSSAGVIAGRSGIAALGMGTILVCCGFATPGRASPPFGKLPALGSGRVHKPLDLRPPPAHESIADRPANGVAAAIASARSSLHRGDAAADGGSLPALGAAAGQARVMSRAEALVTHFHREGLPLARLWENHSALISLGLNPKGKPGLWFVQKTR
ncbi:MAG: hypothetical protein JWN43_1711 [Gammaproteobacteria bacterium]|nr:hypothetical protein [Gammaproteobacteria bacterium]